MVGLGSCLDSWVVPTVWKTAQETAAYDVEKTDFQVIAYDMNFP
jgi:hypothetical protein